MLLPQKFILVFIVRGLLLIPPAIMLPGLAPIQIHGIHFRIPDFFPQFLFEHRGVSRIPHIANIALGPHIIFHENHSGISALGQPVTGVAIAGSDLQVGVAGITIHPCPIHGSLQLHKQGEFLPQVFFE